MHTADATASPQKPHAAATRKRRGAPKTKATQEEKAEPKQTQKLARKRKEQFRPTETQQPAQKQQTQASKPADAKEKETHTFQQTTCPPADTDKQQTQHNEPNNKRKPAQKPRQ